MRRRELLRVLGQLPLAACGHEASTSDRPRGPPRVVLKHQPLWGDPAPFRALLDDFARERGIEVATEPLPNASDVMHQFFVTALEGGASDFDVMVVDVVWVPEFARAGWIADLSSAFPPAAVRRDFLEGAAEAVIVDDRTFAIPWYVDVGLLYRRTDVVREAPATLDALAAAALAARGAGDVVHGYVWQARQYEGLVCNVFEAIWAFGGATMQAGRVLLDTPEARAALEWLRALVVRGASPRAVTSYAEEESRRAFQAGRAAFMRNWPYAYAEAQRVGSPVRGKVAVSAIPSVSGAPGQGVLGGFQLAVNARSPAWKREAVLGLVTHLTSLDANAMLAVAYARNPARRAAYADARVRAGAPQVAAFSSMIARARPRPVTPYYPLITDALQGEFSAAITGIRAPAEALRRAQAQVDHLTRGGT